MRWWIACVLMIGCGSVASAPAKPAPADHRAALALLQQDAGSSQHPPIRIATYGALRLTADGHAIETGPGGDWLQQRRPTSVVDVQGDRVRVRVDTQAARLLVWIDRADTAPYTPPAVRTYDELEEDPFERTPTLTIRAEVKVPARTCLYDAVDGALVGVTNDALTWSGVKGDDGWSRLEVSTGWGTIPLYARERAGRWDRC